MADKKLARHITVEGRTYGPDDEVPADVAEKIRNPKAWVEVDAAEQEPAKGPAGTTDGRKLATAVSVGGRTYGPDDFVPDDVAAQIRNPKAWAEAAKAEPEPDDGADTDTAAAKPAKKAAAKATGDKG